MRSSLMGSVVALGLVVAGCHDPSGGPKRRDLRPASTSAAATSATGPGGAPARPAGTTPATTPAPASRLQAGDKGVQIGLRLLRADITPADAASAWAAERVTPEEARDLLGRLPLTPAFGPGKHQATIVDRYGRSTDLTVIVPGVAPPPAGFPVLLSLHGLGGNSSHIASGAPLAPEAIIVGPTAQRPPAGVVLEDDAPVAVLKMFPHWWVYRDHAFATRALDWVRERYPVDSDRIVINGASMGGFGAWNLGLRLHDRFAGLVIGAGGLSRKEYALGRDTLTRRLLENAAMVPTFFAHGDVDQVVPVTFSRWADQDLTALGIAHTYREVAGAGHDPAAFSAIQPELAAWVRARRRDASPARVTHRAIAADHLGAYWVELKGAGTLEASVSGTTIAVKTSGPGATVFLDPALLDPKQPVTVTINGATVHQGVVASSLAAVARSFARTRDPRLTYCHVISP